MRQAALIALALMVPAVSQAKPVESGIEKVTIYPNNVAKVERVATVKPGDIKQVSFAGLPAKLNDNSLSVSVTSGDALITGVQVERVQQSNVAHPEIQQIRKQIDDLLRERAAIKNKAQSAKDQLALINNLAELPKSDRAAQEIMEQAAETPWRDLIKEVGAASRMARDKQAFSEMGIEKVQETIDAHKRRLRQFDRASKSQVNVHVPIRDMGQEPAEIKLTYHVRGPSWQPFYNARLDTESGDVDLERHARVQQSTGNRWEDVTLALSTATPTSREPRELNPWWINLKPKQDGDDEVGYSKQAEGQLRQLASDMGGAAAARAPARAPAKVINPEFATTFELPDTVTIGGNNQPHNLLIGSNKLSTDLAAMLQPQTDKRAWLIADTEWSGEGMLPVGRMSRFRDGSFVGTTQLESWAPEQERTLNFGVDPAIEVTYEPLKDKAGDTWWGTSKSTLARTHRLRIRNHHDRTMEVRAKARIPNSKHEDVEVETNFSAPPTTENVEDTQGVHQWVFNMEPNSTVSTDLGFRVTYPEGRDLTGIYQ